MICKKCNSKKIQCGGDGFGRVFFQCNCSNWRSASPSVGAIGYYNGSGVEECDDNFHKKKS